MTDRPIIFSAPMVRALLEGRKTQTRRVLKPQPSSVSDKVDALFRFRLGDRLWVREAWAAHHEYDKCRPSGISSHEDIWRVADGPVVPVWTGRCRSPIHMPRWASRLTLTVTEVRVQRLQEISTRDCIAEGIAPDLAEAMEAALGSELAHRHAYHDTYVAGYRDLWNSLHGADAWDANPWVAAVRFTVEHRNIDGNAT